MPIESISARAPMNLGNPSRPRAPTRRIQKLRRRSSLSLQALQSGGGGGDDGGARQNRGETKRSAAARTYGGGSPAGHGFGGQKRTRGRRAKRRRLPRDNRPEELFLGAKTKGPRAFVRARVAGNRRAAQDVEREGCLLDPPAEIFGERPMGIAGTPLTRASLDGALAAIYARARWIFTGRRGCDPNRGELIE